MINNLNGLDTRIQRTESVYGSMIWHLYKKSHFYKIFFVCSSHNSRQKFLKKIPKTRQKLTTMFVTTILS